MARRSKTKKAVESKRASRNVKSAQAQSRLTEPEIQDAVAKFASTLEEDEMDTTVKHGGANILTTEEAFGAPQQVSAAYAVLSAAMSSR